MRCHAMQRRPGSGLHQDWCVPRCDVFGDGARSSRLKDPKAGPHAACPWKAEANTSAAPQHGGWEYSA